MEKYILKQAEAYRSGEPVIRRKFARDETLFGVFLDLFAACNLEIPEMRFPQRSSHFEQANS